MALFSVPTLHSRFPHNLKENFHKVLSSWCPANEAGGCPQIPRSKNPFRWHQPWLPSGTAHLQKERWRHLHHKSEENLGGASACGSCHCCHWKSRCCQCHPVQEDALKFAAATAVTPITRHFTPGTLTNQTLAAFWKPRLLWLLIPGLTTSLSQRRLMSTWPSLLCVTQTLLWALWTLPTWQPQGGYSVGLMCCLLAPGSATHVWHHLPWTPTGRPAWSLLLRRSWQQWKGRAGRCWKVCD